jgi:succinate dehydrogenase/fumarate reductase flavoprotein subunit
MHMLDVLATGGGNAALCAALTGRAKRVRAEPA